MHLDHPRMLANCRVHQRLSDGWFIGLVVAVTAITDHVDNDILIEGLAEFDRDLGDHYTGFRIVAIHMKDGSLHNARNLGTVERRTHITRVTGGKTDLVIDDDVDRAPGLIASGFAHIESFHDHSLAGKGRVSMNQHRQNIGRGAI